MQIIENIEAFEFMVHSAFLFLFIKNIIMKISIRFRVNKPFEKG